VLEELLKLPENKSCADCHSTAPRWASSKLGIFICMKCSGIHRSLGTHISFVRSVTLDKWTATQIDFMQQMGNGRANEMWEGGLPRDFPRPHQGDQHALERFIRSKYEHKRFYRDPDAQRAAPVAAQAAPARAAAQPARVTAPAAPAPAASPAVGSLLDFSTPSVTTTPAPAASTAPKDDFGAFVGAKPSSSSANSLASAFTVTPEAQKANIMNLFNTPASVPAPAPGFGAPAGGYALPPGYTYAAQPPGTAYGYQYPPGYAAAPPGYAAPPPGYAYAYPPGAS